MKFTSFVCFKLNKQMLHIWNIKCASVLTNKYMNIKQTRKQNLQSISYFLFLHFYQFLTPYPRFFSPMKPNALWRISNI